MKHTPGPWRWELNQKSKHVNLCGGVPRYDLTIMDFVRYGMNGASPRFREDKDRMNIMHRADEFGEVVQGREHHQHWFKSINHPDARLIAAAPDLLDALQDLLDAQSLKKPLIDSIEKAQQAIKKATE